MKVDLPALGNPARTMCQGVVRCFAQRAESSNAWNVDSSHGVPEDERDSIANEVADRVGTDIADYVRLRFMMRKPK